MLPPSPTDVPRRASFRKALSYPLYHQLTATGLEQQRTIGACNQTEAQQIQVVINVGRNAGSQKAWIGINGR